MTRAGVRSVAFVFAIGVSAFSTITIAQAQSYPSRSITIVNPYAAGGPADVLTRDIAKELSSVLGQSMVVENRPGAGTMIGATAVARSAPDGYTLLVSTGASHIVSPAVSKQPPYRGISDFALVGMFATVPSIVTIHPGHPAKNVKELIEYARTRSNPLTYGSAGPGSQPHLAGEMFKSMAKINLTHVPYKGVAPAVPDMISGRVDMGFFNVTGVLELVRTGKLRALAVTSATRSPVLPDLPTVAEAGIPGYEMVSWYGFAAPAKTPAAVIDKLYQGIVKVMSAPQIKAHFLQRYGATVTLYKPEQFAEFMQKEKLRQEGLVKTLGLRYD